MTAAWKALCCEPMEISPRKAICHTIMKPWNEYKGNSGHSFDKGGDSAGPSTQRLLTRNKSDKTTFIDEGSEKKTARDVLSLVLTTPNNNQRNINHVLACSVSNLNQLSKTHTYKWYICSSTWWNLISIRQDWNSYPLETKYPKLDIYHNITVCIHNHQPPIVRSPCACPCNFAWRPPCVSPSPSC